MKKTRSRRAALEVRPRAGAPFPIVGIGASAGGLEAFSTLLKHLPLDTGMGFVLVQHLDPQHESALTQLLGRATALPVHEVTNNLRVEPNHVYVIPPNTNLGITGGVLTLRPRPKTRTPHRSIDFFLEALAEDQRERAIGVILSGTATDGTVGLEAIKAEGGITFAQDDSARYDSMPQSAVTAGCVDFVLSPDAIAQEIARIATHPAVSASASATRGEDDRTSATTHEEETGRIGPKAEQGSRQILLLLRNHSGVDFSLYKSTTIQRRISRRMVLSKQNTLDDYARFLRGNAKELDSLYADVLISVTSFFRNPDAFDELQRTVFPRLLQQRTDDPLRVWVLGCSTGQEAYSIAMAFVEAADQARRTRKLQVFATDLNDALLDKARHGLYAKTLAQDLSPERLRRFFVEEEDGYRVDRSLREMVVFARQNVIADPPFSRLDVISCRNLLIYFDAGLQKKIFPVFHYALKPGGFLYLGASESIGGFTDLFEPVDKKHKIFARKAAPTPAFHLPARTERKRPARGARQAGRPVRMRVTPGGGTDVVRDEVSAQREADRVTVHQFAPPAVLINAELQILQFRGPTGAYLEPPSGKASFDLLKMARSGLMLPLRTAITKAKKDNRTVRKEQVPVEQEGKTRTVNLEVIPLKNLRERCFLIVFEDAERAGSAAATPRRKRAGRVRAASESRRSAALETELAETRDYLQSVQEQHETANEELQASNEEVQSANEELQSINEELETSKEELESANEELVTVNEELGHRNAELNRLNSDLKQKELTIVAARDYAQAIIRTARDPLLILTADLRVETANQAFYDTFKVAPTDAEGRLVYELGDHQWDIPRLRELLEDILPRNRVFDDFEVSHDFNTIGRRTMLLNARRLSAIADEPEKILLVIQDATELLEGQSRLRENQARYQALVDTSAQIVWATDARGAVVGDSPSWRAFTGQTLEQLQGLGWMDAIHPEDRARMRELWQRSVAERAPVDTEYRVRHVSGDFRWTKVRAVPLLHPDGSVREWVGMNSDITERKQGEEDLRASEERYRTLFDLGPVAVYSCDRAGVIQNFNRRAAELWGREPATGDTDPRFCGSFKMFRPDGSFMPHEQCPMAAVVAGTLAEVRDGEVIIERPDGSRVTVIVNILPLRNERGEIDGAINCFYDITARKEAEEGRARLSDMLIEADRHKNEFLAMLAHELRNPLAPIKVSIEILRLAKELEGTDLDLGPRVDQALDVLQRQVGLMVRLVDDLLDAGRISRGKIDLRRERVEVAPVVRNAVEASRPLCERLHHELTVTLPPEPVVMDADPARLAQIVGNLLNNSCKFTPPGGRIWLTVERAGEEIVIRVRDTGLGIAPDRLEGIFDMFAQVDTSLERSMAGLGIGLTLVRTLVEMHGGTVQASSPGLGHGSEFVVRLPIVTGAATTVPAPAPAEPVVTPLRILIVDDNRDSADMLATLLNLNGHATHTAHDGVAAVEAATRLDLDVILLDIGLPVLNGYEAARRIREWYGDRSRPALVALTGWGQDADRRRSEEAGFDAHVVKPVDEIALRKLLAELLGSQDQTVER